MNQISLRTDLTERICKKRIIAVGIAFSVFLGYIFFSLFVLQYIKHDYYVKKTYEQITTSSLLKAKRGTIYDSAMNVLATDKTVW